MTTPQPFDCSLCGRRVHPRRYANGTNTMGRRREHYCDRCTWLGLDVNGTTHLDGALAELSYLETDT